MTFKEFVDINLKVSLKKGEEYSFIPMKDVSPGNRYSKATRTKIYKGGGTKFRDHDIIFARITPCLENGKIAQAANLKNGLGFGSTEYFVFRGKKEISDTAYIYYLSLTDIIKKTAEKSMSGASGRQRADIESIKSIELDFPDLPTQHKIASILSAYDDLIENNTRRIKILEEMAQTIYKEWFVNFRFPGHKKVEMVESELGLIPEGWEVKKIGDRFTTVLGGTPSRSHPEYWINGNIPWINSGKVNELRIIDESEYITELGLKKSSTKLMPKRTTVIAITGATLGQVSLLEIEACANQSVVGIYDEQFSYREYIYLKFCEIIKEMILSAGGGAQQHINKEIVSETKIIIPPLSLITKFNSSIRPLFDLTTSLLFKNKILRGTRGLLLPKLISGEIEVENMEID